MRITADTKISVVIRNNPDAIDVLVAASKHFIKLKNPFLRRILAPRVTIAEAAKMGECSVDLILERLARIGFEIGINGFPVPDEAIHTINTAVVPVYDSQLDVRPQLAKGADPFNLIMKEVRELGEGKTLLLINAFEPLPLIRILKDKGYLISVCNISADLVHTYITVTRGDTTTNAENDCIAKDGPLFDELRSRYKNKFVEIDVRHLEMPGPMITILNSIDQLTATEALYIHHKKVPVYLLPELKERGFQYAIKHVGMEVKMIVFPRPAQ